MYLATREGNKYRSDAVCVVVPLRWRYRWNSAPRSCSACPTLTLNDKKVPSLDRRMVDRCTPELLSHLPTWRMLSLGGAKNLATLSSVQCSPKLGESGSEMLSRAWAALAEMSWSTARARSMWIIWSLASLSLLFQCEAAGEMAALSTVRLSTSAEARKRWQKMATSVARILHLPETKCWWLGCQGSARLAMGTSWCLSGMTG